MAGELGRAYFELVPSMRGFSAAVSKELGGGAAATAGAKFGGVFSGGFGKALGPLAGIAVAGLGLQKLGQFASGAVQSLARIGAINAQTASAIKATGGAAQVTAGHI